MDTTLIPVGLSGWTTLLWLVATVLMPLVVGLVTNYQMHAGIKAVLLLLFSAVNGVVTEALAAGDGFNWSAALQQSVVAFIVAVAVHFGVWKPVGAADAATQAGVKGTNLDR